MAIHTFEQSDHNQFNNEWLFLRIYVGVGDCTDDTLPLVYDWLTSFVDIKKINRWHFLRYIDTFGHHLRVRVRADADTIDRLYLTIPQLKLALKSMKAKFTSRVVNDPLISLSLGRYGVTLGVYSPELLKYGGVTGVELAEKHFDISSTWCVNNEIWMIKDQRQRLLIASHYLALIFSRLQVEDAPSLENEHTRRWRKRLPLGLRTDVGKLKNLVSELISYEAQTMDFEPLYDSIVRYSAPLSAQDEPDQWSQQILDLVHMDIIPFGSQYS